MSVDLNEAESNGRLEIVDLETLYCDHVRASFDLDAIRNSGLNLVYDAMYGAGQRVISKILPEVSLLHCDYNPSFKGQAPLTYSKKFKGVRGIYQRKRKY